MTTKVSASIEKLFPEPDWLEFYKMGLPQYMLYYLFFVRELLRKPAGDDELDTYRKDILKNGAAFLEKWKNGETPSPREFLKTDLSEGGWNAVNKYDGFSYSGTSAAIRFADGRKRVLGSVVPQSIHNGRFIFEVLKSDGNPLSFEFLKPFISFLEEERYTNAILDDARNLSRSRDVDIPRDQTQAAMCERRISADELKERFALREVVFEGNFKENEIRYLLNSVWDALNEMAEILSIPYHAVGLHFPDTTKKPKVKGLGLVFSKRQKSPTYSRTDEGPTIRVSDNLKNAGFAGFWYMFFENMVLTHCDSTRIRDVFLNSNAEAAYLSSGSLTKEFIRGRQAIKSLPYLGFVELSPAYKKYIQNFADYQTISNATFEAVKRLRSRQDWDEIKTELHKRPFDFSNTRAITHTESCFRKNYNVIIDVLGIEDGGLESFNAFDQYCITRIFGMVVFTALEEEDCLTEEQRTKLFFFFYYEDLAYRDLYFFGAFNRSTLALRGNHFDLKTKPKKEEKKTCPLDGFKVFTAYMKDKLRESKKASPFLEAEDSVIQIESDDNCDFPSFITAGLTPYIEILSEQLGVFLGPKKYEEKKVEKNNILLPDVEQGTREILEREPASSLLYKLNEFAVHLRLRKEDGTPIPEKDLAFAWKRLFYLPEANKNAVLAGLSALSSLKEEGTEQVCIQYRDDFPVLEEVPSLFFDVAPENSQAALAWILAAPLMTDWIPMLNKGQKTADTLKKTVSNLLASSTFQSELRPYIPILGIEDFDRDIIKGRLNLLTAWMERTEEAGKFEGAFSTVSTLPFYLFESVKEEPADFKFIIEKDDHISYTAGTFDFSNSEQLSFGF